MKINKENSSLFKGLKDKETALRIDYFFRKKYKRSELGILSCSLLFFHNPGRFRSKITLHTV